MMLPCLPGPYAATAYILATTRIMPTKLVGNLTHIPINIPIAVICMILVILNERGDFYTTAIFFESSPTGVSLKVLDFMLNPSTAARGGELLAPGRWRRG